MFDTEQTDSLFFTKFDPIQISGQTGSLMSDILLVGRNLDLLRIRGLLLESRGHIVQCIVPDEKTSEALNAHKVDLLMLCHTVPPEARSQLVVLARAANPGIRVLLLQGSLEESSSWLAETVKVDDGPETLLDVVDQILDTTIH